MHFVTGGAYNGKSRWVKQQYISDSKWFSVYEDKGWLIPSDARENTIIIEGIEHLVREEIDPELSADIILNRVMKKIETWLDWEQQETVRNLVLIGSDISKGIVPVEKADRLQRDVTGWVYQQLVQRAERVDIIWYGIPQKIK